MRRGSAANRMGVSWRGLQKGREGHMPRADRCCSSLGLMKQQRGWPKNLNNLCLCCLRLPLTRLKLIFSCFLLLNIVFSPPLC